MDRSVKEEGGNEVSSRNILSDGSVLVGVPLVLALALVIMSGWTTAAFAQLAAEAQ